MGKADKLLRSMGGTIAESASHRVAPAAMPTAAAISTPSTDRLAGVTRSKAALEIPVGKISPTRTSPGKNSTRTPCDGSLIRSGLGVCCNRSGSGGTRAGADTSSSWASALEGIPDGRIGHAAVRRGRPPRHGWRVAGDADGRELLARGSETDRAGQGISGPYGLNDWSGNQLAKELGVARSGVAQALALLELPAPVQTAVDNGELPPSTAYEITKVEDPVEQAELAGRVVSERLTRAETVEAVKASAKPARAKGRGAKGKARKVTSHVLRTGAGPRVTVEFKRGLDDTLIRTALVQALAQVDARLSAGSPEAA